MAYKFKKNKKIMLKSLLKIFRNFMTFTSLHGIKHIGDDFDYFNKLSSELKLSKR